MSLLAYEDGTECSKMSAYKIQTPGNYPEENIQHTEHGESLKWRISVFRQERNNSIWLMFIIISTNAHVSSLKFILKFLRHVSVFLHHFQGNYKLCQLKLWIIKIIKYNPAACRYGKI
jgi:hypothetical protein